MVDRAACPGRATGLSGHAPGLGEPLRWVDSARLYESDVEPEALSKQVVDHGELDDCTLDGPHAWLSFQCELDAQGADVLVWTGRGVTSVAEIAAEDGRWLLEAGTDVVGLVVAFRRERLGAWWREDWAQALDAVSKSDAGAVARFVRAARLPILEPHSARAVRAFARRFPGACASAWWLDPGDVEEGPTSEVGQVEARLRDLWEGAGAATDRWKSGLRELHADGEPAFDPSASEDVLMALGRTGPRQVYVQVALRRAAALGTPWSAPLLEGQLPFLEKEKRTRGRDWVGEARRALLGEEDGFERPASRAEVRRDLARLLDIDPARCTELVEENAGPISLAKRIALGHRRFAMLSALHALHLVPAGRGEAP